jgi:hypothetical protein
MALDLLFDLLLNPFKFAKLLLGLLLKVVKDFWRAVEVKRKATGEHHTLTEYADAFLFGDGDPGESNSSSASRSPHHGDIA